MSLLVLDHVWKRFARGGRGVCERVALRDVSLEVASAELVAVWGRSRSGRTTLLQVAAGIERPSEGTVRFAGRDLAVADMLGRPGGIGYCVTDFGRVLGGTVLEHVSTPLIAGNVSRARARAREVLRRVDATACADMEPAELDHAEAVRAAIARALVTEPRLLVVDEPTSGVPPASKRDAVLELLLSLARDDGVAVLMTIDEASDFAGADRALTIDSGEVRGSVRPALAPVTPLHSGEESVR